MAILRDKIIVIDLEATCWKKKPPEGQTSEIIEVGVSVFDLKTGTPTQKRGILVKPIQSAVSEFCTELTSITQAQAESGIPFTEACELLTEEYQAAEYLWMSWGNYDLRMFQQQCKAFGVPYPLSDYHVNLKQLYGDVRRKGRRCGLARAMKQEALAMEGHHHRGGDDAWNTTRLLAKLVQDEGAKILEAYWPDER